MRLSSNRRKVSISFLLFAAISTFLCIFSSLEIEDSNAQLVASLLLEPAQGMSDLAKMQDSESLDKSDRAGRKDLEQALPYRTNSKSHGGERQSAPALICNQLTAPQFDLRRWPSKLVGANESYINLRLCLLFCSLLI